MKKFNKKTGNFGEVLAQNYLKKQKYKILATNYTNNVGEIDIIAQKKDVIIFIEVKTRSTEEFGLPCEAVTPAKQAKIRKVAEGFLQKNKLNDIECRFDVIEVLDDEINHLEGCF